VSFGRHAHAVDEDPGHDLVLLVQVVAGHLLDRTEIVIEDVGLDPEPPGLRVARHRTVELGNEQVEAAGGDVAIPSNVGPSRFIGTLPWLAIGLPLGFLVGISRFARRMSWPLLIFFQAVGDIAWLPLLIIWFGFSLTSVTFVIVYTIIFPLMVNIVAGIDGVPRDMVRAARSLGASRLRVWLEVILPGSLPAVVTGIRVGLGYGWRALIAAEIIVGTSGIGFMMFDARRAGQVTEVFVGMIVLGVLWYLTDTRVLSPLERGTVERWGMVRRVERAGVAR
jgi:NitT/TauT family transport system permease protein/taurine transport system permease protein